MSKTIYHYPEPDKTTMLDRVKYTFVVAASALGIIDQCYHCMHLRHAIKECEEREVKNNENKMG